MNKKKRKEKKNLKIYHETRTVVRVLGLMVWHSKNSELLCLQRHSEAWIAQCHCGCCGREGALPFHTQLAASCLCQHPSPGFLNSLCNYSGDDVIKASGSQMSLGSRLSAKYPYILMGPNICSDQSSPITSVCLKLWDSLSLLLVLVEELAALISSIFRPLSLLPDSILHVLRQLPQVQSLSSSQTVTNLGTPCIPWEPRMHTEHLSWAALGGQCLLLFGLPIPITEFRDAREQESVIKNDIRTPVIKLTSAYQRSKAIIQGHDFPVPISLTHRA